MALSLTTASVHAEQTFCVDSVAEFDTAYRAALQAASLQKVSLLDFLR